MSDPLVLPASPLHPFGLVTEAGIRDVGRTAFGIVYPGDGLEPREFDPVGPFNFTGATQVLPFDGKAAAAGERGNDAP